MAKSKRKKVALVVGHNSERQGAVRSDTGETEYQFNSRVSVRAERYALKAYSDVAELRVFYRQPGLSYRKEIEKVYDETDAWGADLTCELHFNAAETPAARGSEVLTSGSSASFRAAMIMQRELVARFGMRDRGVKTRKEGRGSLSLISGRAPAILAEPFFGSSPEDCAAFYGDRKEQALAECYVDALVEALDLLPRKDLSESRNVRAAKALETAGKAGTAAATVSAAATAIDASDILEAVQVGKSLESALPWIAGAGFLIAFLILIALPRIAAALRRWREEDHRKELY